MPRLLALSLCLVIMSACTTAAPLSQRYAEVECVDLVAGGTNLCTPDTFAATVDVFSRPVDPSLTRTALDLSGEGQQAYITEVARLTNAKSTADLAAALAAPITRSTAANEPIDKTNFQRRIIYSIGKDRYRIGDRIISAELNIRPVGLEFRKWSRAETQYATYDQARLTNQVTTSVGLEAGIESSMIAQLLGLTLSASGF